MPVHSGGELCVETSVTLLRYYFVANPLRLATALALQQNTLPQILPNPSKQPNYLGQKLKPFARRFIDNFDNPVFVSRL